MKSFLKYTAAAALCAATVCGGSVMADNSINAGTELSAIISRLSDRDTPSYVTHLTPRMQALVKIATLATEGDTALLEDEIEKAIKSGVAPVEIRETLYQGMSYVGLSRIDRAEKVFMQTLEDLNLPTELENAGTVDDSNRFKDGLAVQQGIFGAEHINAMHESTPEEAKHLNVDLLTGFCFGDVYTRKALPLKEREFLTFVYIAALGGCEPQVAAHAQGNLNVGNTREMLLDALTVMVPYIGFPRTLNAQGQVNAVTLKK